MNARYAKAHMKIDQTIPANLQADLRQALEARALFQQTQDLMYLESAAAALQRVLLNPSFSSTAADFQGEIYDWMAYAATHLYQRKGGLANLEVAALAYQQAMDKIPTNLAERSSLLHNYGDIRLQLYDTTNRSDDLSQAVAALEIAYDLTPVESPDWSARASSLANGLSALSRATGRINILHQAVQVVEEAVIAGEILSEAEQALYHGRLGTILRQRYIRLSVAEDLDRAVDALEHAVKLVSKGSPEQSSYQINLANALRSRFEQLGSLADLDRAIESYAAAVNSTLESSPYLAI